MSTPPVHNIRNRIPRVYLSPLLHHPEAHNVFGPNLNAAQLAAATAKDGAHLIVAGAGTGKTKTLVARVAWLIGQGVDPQHIVLLTFTRRAAAEMLERAAELVGGSAHRVRGGTFHAFANRVLREHAPAIGLERSFTILDSSDAEALVGLCRNELGIGGRGRRFPKRGTLLKMISRQINTGAELYDILEKSYPQYLEDADDIERIGELYRQRKRQRNVVDYDDLLVLLLELLIQQPEVRAKVTRDCRYVLVDEYQDTNRLQAHIAHLLAVTHGNIMVVGDEAQSIYAFRGAVVANILDFPELHPECTLHKLEQNYRSVQPVLDLANGVLDSALEGYDKELFTQREGGESPQLIRVPSLDEEGAYVVERVLALREEGVALQDIAVLFRSGFHSNLLELELAKANLPFRKYGGVRFVEAAHIKDMFALLRIIANPHDELAWYRVLLWFDGVGEKTAQRLLQDIFGTDPPHLDASRYRNRPYHASLVSLEAALRGASVREDDVQAVIECLLDYYRMKIPDLYEDAKKRVRDLETLQLLSKRYPTLEVFLTEVALDPPGRVDAKAIDEDEEWLTLSTIHSAKGLEWHTVFVLGLRDGRFPSPYTLDDPMAIEEERRLLYVAVTRAKDALHLLQPATIGRHVFGPGCQLLDDVPALDLRVQASLWAPKEELREAMEGDEAARQRLNRLLKHFT